MGLACLAEEASPVSLAGGGRIQELVRDALIVEFGLAMTGNHNKLNQGGKREKREKRERERERERVEGMGKGLRGGFTAGR